MAVTTLHTRARSAKSTTRQALPASPPWLLPVARYLRSLRLDDIQRAEVCRFIDRYGKAASNTTLRADHAAEVDRLISGKAPRPGDPGTEAHTRMVALKARLDALLGPAPVKFVTASTDETPHDPEAIIPTESDWNEYRQLFDRAPIVAPKPRPAAAVLPPSYRSQTSSAWMIPEDVAERIARTSLVGHFG